MERSKAALRDEMRARRREISLVNQRGFSERIAIQVASTLWWNTAKRIGVFSSLPGEVLTHPLIQLAQEQGKHVAFPVLEQEDAPLIFRFGHRPQRSYPFKSGPFGISEPDSSAPKAGLSDLDVVFFPLLALDSRGSRVGYGKGYYDRTFSAFPMVRRVGLHFECQMVDMVPATHLDLPLHGAVSEEKVRMFSEPTL